MLTSPDGPTKKTTVERPQLCTGGALHHGLHLAVVKVVMLSNVMSSGCLRETTQQQWLMHYSISRLLQTPAFSINNSSSEATMSQTEPM